MSKFTPNDPNAVAAGQKGGAVRAMEAQWDRERKWVAQGIRLEAARLIFQEGIEVGDARGYRRGLRERKEKR